MFDPSAFDLLAFDSNSFDFDVTTHTVSGTPSLNVLQSSGAIQVGNVKTVNGSGQLSVLTSTGQIQLVHVVDGSASLSLLTTSGSIPVSGNKYVNGSGTLNLLTSSGSISTSGDVTLIDLQEQLVVIDANIDVLLQMVTGIKSITDRITFSSAGFIDANVMEVNDNGGLVGDGENTPVGRK